MLQELVRCAETSKIGNLGASVDGAVPGPPAAVRPSPSLCDMFVAFGVVVALRGVGPEGELGGCGMQQGLI